MKQHVVGARVASDGCIHLHLTHHCILINYTHTLTHCKASAEPTLNMTNC